jgi:hypothetical protein
MKVDRDTGGVKLHAVQNTWPATVHNRRARSVADSLNTRLSPAGGSQVTITPRVGPTPSRAAQILALRSTYVTPTINDL